MFYWLGLMVIALGSFFITYFDLLEYFLLWLFGEVTNNFSINVNASFLNTDQQSLIADSDKKKIFFYFFNRCNSTDTLIGYRDDQVYYMYIYNVLIEFIYRLQFIFIDLNCLVIDYYIYYFISLTDIIHADLKGSELKHYSYYDLVYIWLSIIGLAFITILARGIGPRFRIDQLSDLTWKDLLILLVGLLFIIILIYLLGYVCYDFYGVISLIFYRYLIQIDLQYRAGGIDCYLFTIRSQLRVIFANLRYSLLFYGTYFVDITAVDRNFNIASYIDSYFTNFIFFVPRYGIRLVLIALSANLCKLPLLSEFFTGATWPEREITEMLNIFFTYKIDSRKLMLDYIFEGAPLLKLFSAYGYEELEYISIDSWLKYKSIKLRDDIEVWTN